MKLKQKKVFISIVSLLMVGVLSFGQLSIVFAKQNSQDDINITISGEDYSVDKNKATFYNLDIPTGVGIGESYNIEVGIFKWGSIIYAIDDKTGTLSGYYQPLWGQFKAENGLSKYIGKTFDDIKKMKEPKEMETMAGPMDIPVLVHRKILDMIKKAESEQQVKNQIGKTELAKVYLKYSVIYNEKENGDYTDQTMSKFSSAYKHAESVLKADLSKKDEIDRALANLKSAKKGLKLTSIDYKGLKEQIAKADTIIGHQEEYDIFALSNLKENVKNAKNAIKKGAQRQSQVTALEEKLKKSIKDMIKKSDQGKIFTISGKTSTMADDFMNSVITLEEKNGKTIYTIGFKEDNGKGLKSKMSYLKHIQDNQYIPAEKLDGVGEYSQLFRITRNTVNETQIPIILHPVVMDRDIQVNIILDRTTKKPQYNVESNVDYSELENLIRSEQETLDDVNAGIYKPIGSKEYLKKYNNVLNIIKDKTASKDEVERAIKNLKTSKKLDLVLKAIDDFGQEITTAEAELKQNEKYTQDSLLNLKNAVDKANKQWISRYDFTKNTLAEARKELKDALDTLEKRKENLGKDSIQQNKDDTKHTVSQYDFFTNLSWGGNPSPKLSIKMNKYDKNGEGDKIIFTTQDSNELLEFGKIQVNEGKIYSFKEAEIETDGEYKSFRTLNKDFIKTFYKEKELHFKIIEKDNTALNFTVANKLTEEEIKKFTEMIGPSIVEEKLFEKEPVANAFLEKDKKAIKQVKQNDNNIKKPVKGIDFIGTKVPSTGDESNIAIYIGILLSAVASLRLLYIMKKHNRSY